MGWDISLSASKLNQFNACPRCFWDHCNKKIELKTIFPSITNGIDRTFKAYTDRCRANGVGLPVELAGQVPAGTSLFGSVEEIKKYRHWKSCPLKPLVKTKHGVVSLIMAFDDLLIDAQGRFTPLDGKSKGDVPKDDGRQYYGTQVDLYHLALLLDQRPVTGQGLLWYQWPESYDPAHGMRFGNQVFVLDADPNRALDVIERAAACLAGGQPDPSPTCEACKWAQIRVEAAMQAVAGSASVGALAQ